MMRYLPILNILALILVAMAAIHVYVGWRADQQIARYHQTVIVPMTKPAPPGGK